MTLRASVSIVLLNSTLACTACGGGSESTDRPETRPKLEAGSLESAMADLQTASAWLRPSCRWLESGTWVLAYPQETALYETARDLGHILLEQVGTANRIGTPERAWKVTLTPGGKAQSDRCGRGSSDASVWGVPVAERRFIGGKRVKEPDAYNPDVTVFEVEFEWIPTAAGERVKHVLTDKMAVEQGRSTSRVSLRFDNSTIKKGANGWSVQAMSDGYVGLE